MISIEDVSALNFKEYITYQNSILKESIENLFDLIPEQITLNKIQMEQYQLTLYGTTPSKQIYAFLLEVPLRSIFIRLHPMKDSGSMLRTENIQWNLTRMKSVSGGTHVCRTGSATLLLAVSFRSTCRAGVQLF